MVATCHSVAAMLLYLLLVFAVLGSFKSGSQVMLHNCQPLNRPVTYSDELPEENAIGEETSGDNSYLQLPGFGAFDGCVSVPEGCPNKNITFWFYTRSTQDSPVEIFPCEEPPCSYSHMQVDQHAPWKLIIHGYTGWKDYTPNTEIRPALFQHGEHNVISVDYGPLVKEPCYLHAAGNVPTVGKCIAQLIDSLVDHQVLQLAELHVVAFSLGAQVASQIGSKLKSGNLSRISGLDPAWPLFMGLGTDSRLDSSDAEFVDVIHTDMGDKGQPRNCGHVDFYPNGGYSQLGCTDKSPYGSTASCNHARAPVYYAESLSSEDGFWAVPCNSYALFYWGWCTANETDMIIMGEYTPTSARGAYYLQTRDEPPYALGKQGAAP